MHRGKYLPHNRNDYDRDYYGVNIYHSQESRNDRHRPSNDEFRYKSKNYNEPRKRSTEDCHENRDFSYEPIKKYERKEISNKNDNKNSLVKDNEVDPNKKEEMNKESCSVEDDKQNIAILEQSNVNSKINTKPLGRCRLFIGNLSKEVTEKIINDNFKQFGELTECFVNQSKSFAFISFTNPETTLKAKTTMDYSTLCGRQIRVRFATIQKALKVKNLSPFVTNELLYDAFTQFGQVDRSVVIIDDKGKPTGEGIVEFSRKSYAQKAMNLINNGVYFLTSELRPITVEVLECNDEEDGQSENSILKTNQYYDSRESGPRFADCNSFDYEIGLRWKTLYEQDFKRRENVKKQFEHDVIQIEQEMDLIYKQHKAKLMRENLLRQEEELRMLDAEITTNRRPFPPVYEDMNFNEFRSQEGRNNMIQPPNFDLVNKFNGVDGRNNMPPQPQNFDAGNKFNVPPFRNINIPNHLMQNLKETIKNFERN